MLPFGWWWRSTLYVKALSKIQGLKRYFLDKRPRWTHQTKHDFFGDFLEILWTIDFCHWKKRFRKGLRPTEIQRGNGKSTVLTADTSSNTWFSLVILVFRGVLFSSLPSIQMVCPHWPKKVLGKWQGILSKQLPMYCKFEGIPPIRAQVGVIFHDPWNSQVPPEKTAKVKSFTEVPKNGAMSRGAFSMMAGMDDKNLDRSKRFWKEGSAHRKLCSV